MFKVGRSCGGEITKIIVRRNSSRNFCCGTTYKVFQNTKSTTDRIEFDSSNNYLINNIERCVFNTNNLFQAKREKEFRDGLSELKNYCSQLNDELERNLNEKSWNFLIQQFCKEESFNNEAMYWFNRIMKEKQLVTPNSFTLNAVIKSYSNVGDTAMCEEIVKQLESVGKCNVFSYMHLINAYIKNEDLDKAITIIKHMKSKNVEPNFGIYIPLLKEATKCNNRKIGLELYEMIKNSNLSSQQLSMTIVTFALKLMKPDIVIEECEKMKRNGLMNTISWNCFIQAFIQKNDINKSIKLITEMKENNINPDSTTFTVLLSACASGKLFEEGKSVHSLAQTALKDDFSIELSTAIVNFYTKCGYPDIAIKECEGMKNNRSMNTISWNCLIQAFIQKNDINKAIFSLRDMKENNVNPNSTTFTILLTACANAKLFEEGTLIHELARKTLKEFTIEFSNTIVNFYTKCGYPDISIKECEYMRRNGLMNTVTWNCLIQAFIQNNDIKKSIDLIMEMKESGVNPDSTSFNVVLSACANSKLFEEGNAIHEMAQRTLREFPIELSTTIVNFYTKCGYPDIAIEECDKMKKSGSMNVITWTCLIQAFIQKNDVNKAILSLKDMKENNINPNSTTFTVLLTACANSKLLDEGKSIHEMAQTTLKDDFSIELSTSIVNFYTKCGYPDIAIKECEYMRQNGLMNIVTWNCLIQAFIQTANNSIQSLSDEDHSLNKAVQVYNEMKQYMIEPDKITYCILLSACGEYVATDVGMKIIEDIQRMKMDNMHQHCEEIVSGMVYFYSRIGQHSTAQQLFDNLVRNVGESKEALSIVTYNNMLSCYAQHGKGDQAHKLFNEMVEKKVVLDEITFIILLNAYSHCGMVSEAIQLYNELQSKHKFNPTITIDCVMVDVFSRAGRFEEAEQTINNRTDIGLWSALMGGCRKFNNIELGEKVYNKITSIDENQTAPYILLSHIYTYHGLNEKADKIRKIMQQRGIKKTPGIVNLEDEHGKVFKFVSGSYDYDRFDEVERMRDEIYRKIIRAGFKPDTRWATNAKLLTEEEKINSLSRHAEKTAIAHAFVLNPNRKSIVLTKNLRVCNDCHLATEYISKVMQVEIIVRDSNRYHHFKDGKCSCDGYW